MIHVLKNKSTNFYLKITSIFLKNLTHFRDKILNSFINELQEKELSILLKFKPTWRDSHGGLNEMVQSVL